MKSREDIVFNIQLRTSYSLHQIRSSEMALSDQATNQTSNHTTALEGNDPLFQICWRRQSCSYCLAGDVACSWCAISSTCVPNTSRLPILAPVHSTQICPLGSKERWEMRALPFGCNVSSVTFLSVLTAVFGTLVLVCVGFVVVGLVNRVRRRWKEVQYERLDGQEESPALCGCFDPCEIVSRLMSLFRLDEGQAQVRTRGQEDGQGIEESTPLLA